jgi:hypothetical protein
VSDDFSNICTNDIRKEAMPMRKENGHKICFTALLLLIFAFVTGCSDPDKAGNPGLTPPTVTSVAPPKGVVGACPNTIVTATFSKAMNPATINDTTFTLTGPGPTSIGGVVTYNAASNTAIFTPSNTLAPGGRYIATARVTDPKRSENNEATCNALFSVKELPKNPPSISCSADPSTVQTGTSSTIRLYLHESGQCPSHGRRLDGKRRQRFQ